MILGIAYHSPLDVITLLPIDASVTLNPQEPADILLAEEVVDNYIQGVQLVFASHRLLSKKNLSIIDQGPWGKILNLTATHFEKIVVKGKESNNDQPGIPEWVRLSKC